MRIPKRDVTYIILSVYLLTLIRRYILNRKQSHYHEIDLIQLNISELELDFAQHIQYMYTDVRIADL